MRIGILSNSRSPIISGALRSWIRVSLLLGRTEISSAHYWAHKGPMSPLPDNGTVLDLRVMIFHFKFQSKYSSSFSRTIQEVSDLEKVFFFFYLTWE